MPASARPTFETKYRLGGRVHWSGLTSTSTSFAKAQDFAAQGGPGGFVCTVRVKTGRNIQPFSAIGEEEEVLLLPNTAFFVSQALKGDKIELVEVDKHADTVVF